MILQFSQLGIIGQMFKSLDLSLIVESILVFYRDKPIDWLRDHILWVKVCNPEKNAKLWDPHKAYLRVRFNLSLFQFVSTQSLLAGGQDPETEGQGLGEAGIAGRVLQHTSGGEHEPRDLAALPHGAGAPAWAFFLRFKVRCGGLHPLLPLLAVRSGAVLVPQQE